MAEGRRSNGAGAPPADALKDAGQRLLDLLVQRSAEAATQRVNGLTVRLSDVTDSGGDLRAALRRNPEKDGQASRPGGLRGTLSEAWRRALSGLQNKMQNIFGGGRGAEQLTRSNLLDVDLRKWEQHGGRTSDLGTTSTPELRYHHALPVHPCTSKCSPCSGSDSVELHWRPRRRPRARCPWPRSVASVRGLGLRTYAVGVRRPDVRGLASGGPVEPGPLGRV